MERWRGGGGEEVEGEKATERVREGWRARGIEWETEMEGERKRGGGRGGGGGGGGRREGGDRKSTRRNSSPL